MVRNEQVQFLSPPYVIRDDDGYLPPADNGEKSETKYSRRRDRLVREDQPPGWSSVPTQVRRNTRYLV
jgi:hypothetical protein